VQPFSASHSDNAIRLAVVVSNVRTSLTTSPPEGRLPGSVCTVSARFANDFKDLAQIEIQDQLTEIIEEFLAGPQGGNSGAESRPAGLAGFAASA
jgi:hypothetical protein